MNTLVLILILGATVLIAQRFFSKRISFLSSEEKEQLKKQITKSNAISIKLILILLMLFALIMIVNNLDVIKEKLFSQ
jgi:hypothetical protein